MRYSISRLLERWAQKLAIALVHRLGWSIHNLSHPTVKKAVVVLAPHTSNWDFFYGMLFRFSCPSLPIRFAIKKEVMFFPLSYLMKALGAIPIDRSGQQLGKKQSSRVTFMVELFNRADKLLLIIAPEGTRKCVRRWKTGFYRIAEAANVPIILGYIDYAQKTMGLGPFFYPTGNIETDIATIQDFYRPISGKHPEQGVR
ncbi:1-acyl-sn-glycerol-3-phosphate acyltransferase [Candidatus Cardinium hertigii]|uniref:Phospholipid/glycerol acyltransferase domain-containing protein n=1 Tax=Candidatus Cardinium hertigii TaxID=247481 RepID=A0A2Z3L9W9_9BACT|nr:1-acyl-sn-glycerol-3-phosphate acyltransferase [Candidatus Cardinium hertigii]AWN82137.1 hypothetical protein DK880_00836 [Candidatus Cardinium hertigii]